MFAVMDAKNPSHRWAMADEWSLQTFLQTAPLQDIDYVFMTLDGNREAAASQVQVWYNEMLDTLQQLQLPADEQQARLDSLFFSTCSATECAPWLAEVSHQWTVPGPRLTASVYTPDGWWKMHSNRLDAWQAWAPQPDDTHPSQTWSCVYMANPCFPLDSVQPDIAGKWVLAPNNPLCQYEEMATYIQKAGGVGLIIYASRDADLQVMMPADMPDASCISSLAVSRKPGGVRDGPEVTLDLSQGTSTAAPSDAAADVSQHSISTSTSTAAPSLVEGILTWCTPQGVPARLRPYACDLLPSLNGVEDELVVLSMQDVTYEQYFACSRQLSTWCQADTPPLLQGAAGRRLLMQQQHHQHILSMSTQPSEEVQPDTMAHHAGAALEDQDTEPGLQQSDLDRQLSLQALAAALDMLEGELTAELALQGHETGDRAPGLLEAAQLQGPHSVPQRAVPDAGPAIQMPVEAQSANEATASSIEQAFDAIFGTVATQQGPSHSGSRLHIPMTQISYQDGQILRSMITMYGSGTAPPSGPAMEVLLQFHSDQVPRSFVGISAQGRLLDVDWSGEAGLAPLVKQAHHELSLNMLYDRLTAEPTELTINIVNQQAIASEHGVTVWRLLPDIDEQLPPYTRVLLHMQLVHPEPRVDSTQDLEHMVQVFACCGDGCQAFELGRWINPFRHHVGHWITDVTILSPLLLRGMCKFTVEGPSWAVDSVVSLSLGFSHWEPVMPSTSESLFSSFLDQHVQQQPSLVSNSKPQLMSLSRKLLMNVPALKQSVTSVLASWKQQLLPAGADQQEAHLAAAGSQPVAGPPVAKLIPFMTVPLFMGGMLGHPYQRMGAVKVLTPAGAARAVLSLVISGHGTANFDYGDFCSTVHSFSVNGKRKLVSLREQGLACDCAQAQGSVEGKYFSLRHNWQGAQVDPWLADVSDCLAPAGAPNHLQYQAQLGTSTSVLPDGILLSSFITFFKLADS